MAAVCVLCTERADVISRSAVGSQPGALHVLRLVQPHFLIIQYPIDRSFFGCPPNNKYFSVI